MSDLLSVLFAVYVFGTVLGGGAFLLKAAAAPQIARHYFEHVTRNAPGTPWSRFFRELAWMSVLWPPHLVIIAARIWRRVKLEERMRKEQMRKEQTRTNLPGSESGPSPTEPPHTTLPGK
ncbi:hypothetical protein ACFQ08_04060 [Streptosporangium algeriense]|uniref:Uncharacterized protein n=1 Tax=Streptosporangium algeriense TaxID=1682748 RepID=A0ABW3DLP0_9ACTN